MAFSTAGLTRVSSGPIRMWTYTTTDTYSGTVDQADYFLDTGLASQTGVAAEIPHIRPNDIIIIAAATGGTDTFHVVGVLTSTSTAITTQAIV